MPEANIDPLEKILLSLDEGDGPLIICRCCTNPITRRGAIFHIGQRHQFSFTNPEGISYHLSCYRQAPGCSISGIPTIKDSWFGGYQWQFIHCSECHEHLGWYYQNTKDRFFFGLIDNRITLAPFN